MRLKDFTMNYFTRILLETQQPHYKRLVGSADDPRFTEIALAFLGFLGEDMPFERLLVGDLSRSRYFEPLLGAGVRFDLRHWRMLLCNSLLADPHRRIAYGAVWGRKGI
jgi:hypothetical protein